MQLREGEFEQRFIFGQGNQTANGNHMDEEEVRAERTRRITAALKATSFVSFAVANFVMEGDLSTTFLKKKWRRSDLDCF